MREYKGARAETQEREREREREEGGEASELSAGLFWKHTFEILSLNSCLLFLLLLYLPVWPYNIIHLVYSLFGAFSPRDLLPPPELKFKWSCNIKESKVWAERGNRARQRMCTKPKSIPPLVSLAPSRVRVSLPQCHLFFPLFRG